MYPLRRRFWHAVCRVSLLAAHSNFDNTRIVLDQNANCLPAQTPQLRQLTDSVVLLAITGIERHIQSFVGDGEIDIMTVNVPQVCHR